MKRTPTRAASIVSTDITPFEKGDDISGTAIPDGYDLVIANATDLVAFCNRVNTGETGLRAIQVADIDLTEENDWTPIGDNYDNRFRGTYNGGGCLITGLKMTTASGVAGLFGYVGPGAILTGIHLRKVAIDKGTAHLGALAGAVYATAAAPAVISHCTAEGKVTGKSVCTGGLVGHMEYTHLTHCHAACTVTTETQARVGGLAGHTSHSIIAACSATGSVSGKNYIGGLVGYAGGNSNIYACRATGKVKATSFAAGGFVGNNDGSTITGCYASGGVNEGFRAVFGDRGTFAGENRGTITYCHAVKGADGGVTGTVGTSGTIATIATEENLRYATVAADGIAEITASTIGLNAAGEAILPPVLGSFKASEIWTEEEMPENYEL